MTRWLLVVISVILLATVTPIHDSAIAQNQGAIRGVVANGTTNTFVPDVHVLLQIIRNGIPMETLETKTDAEGHFRFPDLPLSGGILYTASTEYDGVIYKTSTIEPTQLETPVHIVVYETTTSDSDIGILKASMAVSSVDESTGLIQLLEVITFINKGTETYVGKVPEGSSFRGVLRLHLPPASLDLNLGSGFSPDGPLPASDGLLTRAAVPPGELLLIYAYKIPFTSDTHTIEKLYAYAADEATFLISTAGPRPSSGQLTDVTTVNVNNTPNFSLSGTNVARGKPILVTLTNLPHLLPPRTGGTKVQLDTALRWVGIAGMLALLVTLALYTMLNGTGSVRSVEDTILESHTLEQEHVNLVASIAELDKQFELGLFVEADYEITRASLKDRLLDILLLIQEQSQLGRASGEE
ncbi:hypothetical protein M1O29_00145 [Dehalococcoidia bacterium]|nr:hypothetical protein [Dehalococcoidia bacterium]